MVCTAESSKGLTQLGKRDAAKSEARERPWQLITDLQASSNTCMRPSIRVELNLEAASRGPEEVTGTVVLKVGLSPCFMKTVPNFVRHALHNSTW